MALINWAILVWIFRPLMFNKKLRTKWKLFVQLFLQILLNSSRRRIPRSRVKTKNIFAYRRKIPKISRCLNFCCFEFRVERRIFASNKDVFVRVVRISANIVFENWFIVKTSKMTNDDWKMAAGREITRKGHVKRRQSPQVACSLTR